MLKDVTYSEETGVFYTFLHHPRRLLSVISTQVPTRIHILTSSNAPQKPRALFLDSPKRL